MADWMFVALTILAVVVVLLISWPDLRAAKRERRAYEEWVARYDWGDWGDWDG